MEDRFLYSEADDTIFIKIEGNATMKNSKTLSDLLAKIFKGEKKNLTELIIAKNRNGPTETVELYFHKNFTRFREYSQRSDV